MPPRLSLRRLFLYVVGCGGAVLLLSNVKAGWSRWHEHSSDADDGLELDDHVASTTAGVSAPSVALAQRRAARKPPPPKPPPQLSPAEKPWFMVGGKMRPKANTIQSSKHLFPSANSAGATSDRIAQQLMYIPPDYSQDDHTAIKKILVYNGLATWAPAAAGMVTFTSAHCPVARCSLTANRDDAADADAILYKDQFLLPAAPRPPNQIWILYFLECPYHTGHMKYNDVFNWTATYRRDSDIVAPYERWAYYNDNIRQRPQERNYAANKTRKVAWFVSNCGARNERLAYARELQKHISVDIYGSCGPLKCARSNNKHCFELLNNDYKFYLAFENSNCRDYITEKFYVNGLGQNVLPIVMGARPEDYEKSAPYRSYIHVDEFQSPKELAQYLHRLDKNDELYNSYFRWKGTGEFINTFFWCRLCAMLHGPTASARFYEDVNEWWRGNGVCNSGSWRKKHHH